MLALAVLVCIGGGWVALELHRRALQRSGRQQVGWVFLAAVAAGSSVWCTHFVAMLAYRADIPVLYDPVLTLLSLLAVVGGTTLALLIAVTGGLASAAIGGALLGLSVAAMHYVGMLAYRIDGLLSWNATAVGASVLLSVVFAAASLAALACGRRGLGLAAFVACVLALHFTGMAALTVYPLPALPPDAAQVEGLAVAIASGVLLVIATGVASHMIDSDMNQQTLGTLKQMALSDALTGLPNRNSFVNFMPVKLARALLDRRCVAVVLIDLDRLKDVNDRHGHDAGDQMLAAVAGRLRQALKRDEFLARMAGDEFAALKPIGDVAEADAFVTRLEQALMAPLRIKGTDLVPRASFGVSIFPSDGDTPARLIGSADLAMARAKADVTRAVCFYEASMDEAARRRRELVAELRTAVEQEQFTLHYQVQADVRCSQVVGYEALVRWRHPGRGFVSPADFIPAAEESGLILPLGEWVLRTACAEAAAWPPTQKVAVNLSAVQIAHCDLPALVADVLEESGLAPGRLELEITESAIIQDKERCFLALQAIRDLGVTIAIDDFGTGYSSLETLRTFPFSRIKLDRSFMADITRSPQARAILRAVLALGRSLDIKVLAEGVETLEQLRLLEAEGCHEVQGYLLGRPQPVATGLSAAVAGAMPAQTG
ncbi:putative bifunctional diguanylate cyclase/phosphodiesterase [Ancylobacter lacus]|uniref:putative bifunctional diguanylate cyclase/phosphodiesterase n=1 Tax=Ancylobacter lacus TaxID=2579970 RepID=UPI001BCB37B0|nr:EAL domain-containing protein [Ancylobacter lacus]MBS7540570.1 EAL domain-containing protein [Ancylobacter lacus]